MYGCARGGLPLSQKARKARLWEGVDVVCAMLPADRLSLPLPHPCKLWNTLPQTCTGIATQCFSRRTAWAHAAGIARQILISSPHKTRYKRTVGATLSRFIGCKRCVHESCQRGPLCLFADLVSYARTQPHTYGNHGRRSQPSTIPVDPRTSSDTRARPHTPLHNLQKASRNLPAVLHSLAPASPMVEYPRHAT